MTSIHVRFNGENKVVKEALDIYVRNMENKQIVKNGKKQKMSMNDCAIYLMREGLKNELTRIMNGN